MNSYKTELSLYGVFLISHRCDPAVQYVFLSVKFNYTISVFRTNNSRCDTIYLIISGCSNRNGHIANIYHNRECIRHNCNAITKSNIIVIPKTIKSLTDFTEKTSAQNSANRCTDVELHIRLNLIGQQTSPSRPQVIYINYHELTVPATRETSPRRLLPFF